MNGTCAIYVDAGTTNTRVWLMEGERVIARADAMVGVRDTAREGSSERLRNALRDLIAEVSAQPQAAGLRPQFVAAAGMITSSLGLAEVPHVVAPAGIDELAAGIHRCEFPEITPLKILLVPGVLSGSRDVDLNSVSSSDLMRGEESMCAGLLASGLAPKPCAVLNLGSHWKLIKIDEAGRIAGSVTSLTGEMIHTTQTQTILASAVPHDRPETLDFDWVEAGMREERRSGLARSMFCVRLLEQGKKSTPEQRLAFLIGAFIAADLDAQVARGLIVDPVLITGGGVIAEAWKKALAQASLNASVISAEQIERALLTGLQKITSRSLYI